MKRGNKKVIACLIISILVLMSIHFVIAAATPEGPTVLSEVYSSRRATAASKSKEAEAGNITELSISAVAVTQTWQGFVGTVSGVITLDDADNATLYNWSLADPEGEVYATYLTSINWTTGAVLCWNYSISQTYYLQLGELEGWYSSGQHPANATTGSNISVNTDDADGMNETFICPICQGAQGQEAYQSNLYNHSSFYVGGQIINGIGQVNMNDTCPYVKTYNSSGQLVVEEVILYQDSGQGIQGGSAYGGIDQDGLIYTAIIAQDTSGYNGSTFDFQMLVGDNGHNGNTATTTYYFYVELE